MALSCAGLINKSQSFWRRRAGRLEKVQAKEGIKESWAKTLRWARYILTVQETEAHRQGKATKQRQGACGNKWLEHIWRNSKDQIQMGLAVGSLGTDVEQISDPGNHMLKETLQENKSRVPFWKWTRKSLEWNLEASRGCCNPQKGGVKGLRRGGRELGRRGLSVTSGGE